MGKRRTHGSEFKARVAMEASTDRNTLQEIAADHLVHPTQVSQREKKLLEGASDLFTRQKYTQAEEGDQATESELIQKLGKLQMELEWLEKCLNCSLMPLSTDQDMTTGPDHAEIRLG